MSSRIGAEGLVQAMKELNLQWEQTKASWHDAKSREFEQKFLSELPDSVAKTGRVIEELDVLLRKVRSDCE